MMSRRPRRVPRPQRGFALAVALVLLLAITMIGLASMGGSLMEERIVGNDRDLNLAFQAAEAALRDGETDVATNITSATTFSSAGTNGLYTPPSTWATPVSTPLWQLVDWTGDTASLATTRGYGEFTASTLPGMGSSPPLYAALPRYVIERLAVTTGGMGKSAGIGLSAPPGNGTYYRVTAYGTGGRADTVTVMQSIFYKQ